MRKYIAIAALLTTVISAPAVHILLSSGDQNIWVESQDPFAYPSAVARLAEATPGVEATYVTNVVQIDGRTQQAATLYASVLQGKFGAGAHTNTAITEDVVATYFIQKMLEGSTTVADIDLRDFLQTYFEALRSSPYNPDPTSVWYFPWGMAAVTNVTTGTVAYIELDGVRYYHQPAE